MTLSAFWIFDSSGFPARWNCGDWPPWLGWLHIASDLLIWSAYLAIPLVLIYFVRRRRDLPFPALFWLFGAFIVSCGTTHLLEAVIFYDPVYRLAGVVKLLTAIASWATVIALVPVIPKALALRSPRELEREVAVRTADLAAANAALRREADDRRKAEDSLRESEARFRNFVEQAGDGFFLYSRDGTVVDVTRDVELDEAYAGTHPGVTPGRHVLLAVSDTGEGMTEQVRARIFEPFYTTKEKGRGTGLGLSTVFGIVKQSGGSVEVYSEPGLGTSFKVYLPRAEEVAVAKQPRTAPTPAPRGAETVLLVEDEDAVRALARLVLTSGGYTVLEAGDGVKALQIAEGHRGPIHLLMSDVVMPEMGGPELAERLAAARPEMRVLFLSGYTDDAIVRHGILQDKVNFLQKPYSIVALAQKVREVLDGGS